MGYFRQKKDVIQHTKNCFLSCFSNYLRVYFLLGISVVECLPNLTKERRFDNNEIKNFYFKGFKISCYHFISPYHYDSSYKKMTLNLTID